MKARKWLVVIMSLIMLMSVTACSGEQESDQAPTGGEAEVVEPSYSGIVPINTQTSGNTAYTLSAGLANMINQNKEILPNVQFSAEAIGGDVAVIGEMVKRYEQGTPAIGTTTTWAPPAAYEGRMPEVGGQQKHLRGIISIDPSSVHLVVPADSKIQSYADLKGKKIGGFAPGIGPRHFVDDLLSTQFNIQPDEYEMIPLDNKDRLDSLANGSVDGVFLLGAVPASLVMEAANSDDVRVVSVDKKILESFTGDYPYYSYTTVPAGTYKGTEEEITVGTIGMMFVTHENTPEEIVYEFVKAIIENPDEIKQIHPSYNITLEGATKGITVPFHAGAVKYYKENGLDVE